MLQFVAVLNVKESSVVYDSKIEHYRTPEINSVIGGVAQLSKGLGEIKKSDSQNLFEKSDLVHARGANSNILFNHLAKIDNLKHIDFN